MANNNTNGNGNRRGFAGMDPDKQREIASKGGKAAHEKGTAHEFDSAEAQAAGSKGGKASHSKDSSNDQFGNGRAPYTSNLDENSDFLEDD